MILKKWDDLPEFMKCDEVKVYYDILSRKKGSLVLKRIFDIVVGVILLILLAIPMLIIAVMIKMDSKGPAFYRQERVSRYDSLHERKRNSSVYHHVSLGVSI